MSGGSVGKGSLGEVLLIKGLLLQLAKVLREKLLLAGIPLVIKCSIVFGKGSLVI